MCELQELKENQRGLILTCEEFSQLVRKSQELFTVDKKNYAGVSLEMKDGITFNLLRKEVDELFQRLLPIIEDESLHKKVIIYIHTYGGPSSVYARKLHHSSDAALK